jgi:transcriptional regulator with XRE-family HTH domain
MQTDASVGEKIKQRRNDKNLTQHELAKLLGITRAAVCHWETKGTVPRAKTLAKVAEALKVSEQYLTEGSNGADQSHSDTAKEIQPAPEGAPPAQGAEQAVVTVAELVERTKERIAKLTGFGPDQIKLTLTVL